MIVIKIIPESFEVICFKSRNIVNSISLCLISPCKNLLACNVFNFFKSFITLYVEAMSDHNKITFAIKYLLTSI